MKQIYEMFNLFSAPLRLFVFLCVGIFLCFFVEWRPSPLEQLPTAYNGRYRPLAAVSQPFSLSKNSQFANEIDHALAELKKNHVSPKEIAEYMEQQYPLVQRLEQDDALKLLPSKKGEGRWYPLSALRVRYYDPRSEQLSYLNNFTLYSETRFNKIRELYFEGNLTELVQELNAGYDEIAGMTYTVVSGKELRYPSRLQLQAEALYVKYDWMNFILAGYVLSAILLFAALWRPTSISYGMGLLWAAFIMHGCLLAVRCYILLRPPVSNMFETVIYVPWISVGAGLLLYYFYRSLYLSLAAVVVAIPLLVLLKMTQLSSSLENVQAVLDSQYWLTIHVLLVVGSYGLFALSGVLGHFYLGFTLFQKEKTETMRYISKNILRTMYLGVGLLIPGTILGGVWAAQSWGRFWDWDPKESWAFITICTYLIWIHCYTFNKISCFGLAVGSVVGLLSMSFTWYGVNYILGTGLHSYGFGTGGTIYYALFFVCELLFLSAVCLFGLSRARAQSRSR